MGATVDLGFAVCKYATDLFLIFMFILVQFLVLVIIGGFVYWFGCSLLFLIIFLFYYLFILLFFLFYFTFLFLPFLLSHVTDRVLVLWLVIRPEPPKWES